MLKLFDDRSKVMLNKNTGALPLYMQIADVITEVITEDDVGTVLPSQEQLTEFFGVSRITVRKAIQKLAGDGVVSSRRAKGACILKVPQNKTRYHGLGFTSRYRHLGDTAFSKIITIDTQHYDNNVADILYLPESVGEERKLIKLKRIRFVGNVPVSLETSYIAYHHRLAREMLKFTETSSLYAILKEVLDVTVSSAEEQIKAILCTDDEVLNCLQLDEPKAMLFTERKSFSHDRIEPVEYCETYITSEHYGIIRYSY